MMLCACLVVTTVHSLPALAGRHFGCDVLCLFSCDHSSLTTCSSWEAFLMFSYIVVGSLRVVLRWIFSRTSALQLWYMTQQKCNTTPSLRISIIVHAVPCLYLGFRAVSH